jgi:hypothetical protein
MRRHASAIHISNRLSCSATVAGGACVGGGADDRGSICVLGPKNALMREPADRQFEPVVSASFLSAIHEKLREEDGQRVGAPRACPNCGSDSRRKNGYQNEPKTFARLVTEDGVAEVGVEVQQFECRQCGRSYQGDLSELFYDGCDYAKPVVDLARFHAVDHPFAACERILRRRYGLLVTRDTIERYAERCDEPPERQAIDIAGYRYSMEFLAFLFGDPDTDEPQFVIKRPKAMW